MEEKEKEFKEVALGLLNLKQRVATNDFKPDKEKLKAPLLPDAGLRTFCCGCGAYHEWRADAFEELVEQTRAYSGNKDFNPNPEEHYFEAYECLFCTSDVKKMAYKYIEDGSIYYKIK